MVKLELEITEQMQEELEKVCEKELLPIDHVVRSILAHHICKLQRRRSKAETFLGLPLSRWTQILDAVIATITQEE